MAHSLFSIGHSNHPLPVFMDLLKQHAVQLLVDVRSDPYSRYAPQFTSGSLHSACIVDGLGYLYLGQPPPDDPGPPPAACGPDNDSTHLGCATPCQA